MWERRPLTALWASTACYRDSFILPFWLYFQFRKISQASSKACVSLVIKDKKIGFFLCLINLSKTPWKSMGDWRYSFAILHLGARWRWVVSFTPLPLYPAGKQPPIPIAQEAGWPQGRSARYGQENSLASHVNRTPGFQPLARHYTDWAIN
jgi:hypothetical protein